MSDTSSSRGRVTITLGRSGQVVQRDLSDASLASIGMKSSIRDRVGNNAGSCVWHGNDSSSNKRQRGHSSILNGINDGRISKNDLRLKLMRKSASRQAEVNDVKRHTDLREKLSNAHPPLTPINPKQRMPERSETRLPRQTPSCRSSDDVMRMEAMRCSYSPWTMDHNLSRQRSPDGLPSMSREISCQRNAEDLQRRPLNRTYEGVRPVPYLTRDVPGPTRPPSTAPSSLMAHSTVSTLPPVAAKPAASHLGQIPPPSNIAQRDSYVDDQPQAYQTVDGLLHALGLGKYVILFKAEEIDMTALRQMRENDLKELGIPMGPRKKLLLALLPRAKCQQ